MMMIIIIIIIIPFYSFFHILPILLVSILF